MPTRNRRTEQRGAERARAAAPARTPILSRLLWPFAILLGPLFLVVAGLILWTATEADEQRYRLARDLVETRLGQTLRRLQVVVEDVVWSDLAAQDGGRIESRSWLDRHVTDRLFAVPGVGALAMMTESGEILYHEEAPGHGPLTLEATGLERIMRNARSFEAEPDGRLPPNFGFILNGGELALAAVANVDSLAERLLGAEEPTSLVVVRPFDDFLLQQLSEAAALDRVEIRVPPLDERGLGPWLPVRDADGRLLATLTWHMDRLVTEQLPTLGFLFSIMAAFGLVATRQAVSAARVIERHQAALVDFAESASDWMWETDAQGRITWVSPRFFNDTGLAAAAVIGRRPGEFLRRPADGEAVNTWPRGRAPAVFRDVVRAFRNAAGDLRLVQIGGRPVHDQGGKLTGFRGSATDVTERYRAEQEVRFLAERDPLTGLLNRKVFEERMEHALAIGRRSGPRAALLVMDLDDFKQINDSLGHQAGDRILRTVARRLTDAVRETDMVARLGGDEFAILLAEIGSTGDALAFAYRLVGDLSAPVVIDDDTLRIGASVGIAFGPEEAAVDADGWLRRADLALYRAKETVGERIQVFRAELDQRRRRQQQRRHDIARALESGAFTLRFQPQVELAEESVVGVEALLRWRHETRGWIPPQLFIPEAEACGLILPIGRWVLHEACRTACGWLDDGLDFGRIAVNLSPVQFGHQDMVAEVREALAETRLPADRLELEITEGMLMRDAEDAALVLRRLTDLDVTLTLDDFGKGYSSLAYLRRFPLGRLKIDQAFVRDVATDADAAAITRAIIVLGHNLRLAVIGEGVETEAQKRQLRQQGCDAIQGHAIAPPLSPEAIREHLRRDVERQSGERARA